MGINGTIVLSVVGICFAILTGYSVCRVGWKLSAIHLTLFGISAILVIAAFLPLTKFQIGVSGISAEIAQQKIKVLETIISSGPDENKEFINALSEGAKTDEWVSVPEGSPINNGTMPCFPGEMDVSDGPISDASIPDEFVSEKPNVSVVTEAETENVEGHISPTLQALSDQGIVRIKDFSGNIKVKVSQEYAEALKEMGSNDE